MTMRQVWKEMAWGPLEIVLWTLLTVLISAAVTTAILTRERGQRTNPSPPKFIASQCFNLNGIREPWQDNGPDGIVVLRGYNQYLVMFREEAERTGGGTKKGSGVEIEWFDDNHYEVQCPKSWREHTHAKSNRHS